MDRDDLKVIAFAHPWKKSRYQVVKSKQLQGKGQVAEVTQYRHFENLPKIDEGNLVNPFGIGPEIPEFPEISAYKTSCPKGHQRAPVSAIG